ncbi:MAG: hypothetical protein EBT12_15725 [Marivivens sp.]|nr:hypothetical protein [Marivivens sp.]
MPELSPQAQEVFWAFNREASGKPDDWHYLPAIAAALRAVADQVVPYLDEPDWVACDEMKCDIELHTDHMRKRNQLLAIAAELRGDTTTQEGN